MVAAEYEATQLYDEGAKEVETEIKKMKQRTKRKQ